MEIDTKWIFLKNYPMQIQNEIDFNDCELNNYCAFIEYHLVYNRNLKEKWNLYVIDL